MRVAYLHYLTATDSALTHVDEFSHAARDLGAEMSVHALHAAPARAPSAESSGAPQPRSVRRRLMARHLHEPLELARNLPRWRQERRIVQAVRPDVLLVRTRLLTASFVVTARQYRLPLVLEVNAPVLESTTHTRDYMHLPWLPAALEHWQLAAADAIVAVSSPLKAYLLERSGVPEDKVVVVPNGADVTRFAPDLGAESIAWASAADGPVVGFVGSFQEFHGTDLLARMIVRVARQRPAARFLLVGDGAQADAVQRLLHEVGDRLRFTGRVPHARVPALVRAFDIGVLPDTAFYCSPLKVVEWMAAGRAIVAPAYASLTDLVTDGDEAVLFPPRDEDALVAMVVALIDDPARRRALGAAARARALTALTWRHNAARVLAVCRSVTAPSRTA